MAQILVRNLDELAVDTLKKRAAANNRSLQVEVKLILETEARLDRSMATAKRRFSRLRTRYRGRGLEDSTSVIRDERDTRG